MAITPPPSKKGASGKYKTYQRGESGSIGGGGGTPQQQSSYPEIKRVTGGSSKGSSSYENIQVLTGQTNQTPISSEVKPQTPTPPPSVVSQKAVNLFQGRTTTADFLSGKPDSSNVSVSGGVAQKLAREQNNMSIREDVNYQVRGNVSKRQSVDPLAKAEAEFVGPRKEKESIQQFSSSIIKGGIKTADRVLTQTTPGVKLANQLFFNKGSQSSKDFLNDSDVQKFSKVVTAPYFSIIEPTAKGTYKILSSEITQGKGRGLIGPDLSLKTAKRRLDLINDSDVQTTLATAGFVGLGSAGKIGSGVARAAGVAGGGYEFFEGVKNRNPSQIGTGSFLVATSNPLSGLQRIGTQLIGERILPETITGKKVTSKTVEESLVQFEKGKTSIGTYEVVSASPNKLVGDLRAGPKGIAGVEDPGLYVAPIQRANLAFAGIAEAGSKVESIGLFNSAKRPTVNIFEVQDVVRIPRNIINEPGFITPSQESFRLEAGKKGVAIITKRSELGKGSIAKQIFSPSEDLKTSGGLIRRKGFNYLEAGTSESEAIIPITSNYVPKDFTFREKFRYTIINPKKVGGFEVPFSGELVRVPKYKVVAESDGVLFQSGKSKVVDKDIVKIKSESVSSFIKNKKSVPLRSFSFGKSSGGVSNAKSVLLLSSSESVVSQSSPNKSVSNSLVRSDNVISKPLFSSSSKNAIDRSSNVISGSNLSNNSFRNISERKGFSPIKIIPSERVIDLSSNVQTKNIRSPFSLDKKDKGGLFDVEIRRGGKIKTIGSGLGYEQAERVGKRATQFTAARSYRIKQGETILKPTTNSDQYKIGKEGFKIEKSKYAINTAGELGEITYKGIRSSKKKRRSVF